MPVRPGPHCQPAIVPPSVGAVQVAQVVAPAFAQGFKVIVPFAPVAIPWDVINTSPKVVAVPVPKVVTEATYLLPEPAATSQPQPLSATVAPDDED